MLEDRANKKGTRKNNTTVPVHETKEVGRGGRRRIRHRAKGEKWERANLMMVVIILLPRSLHSKRQADSVRALGYQEAFLQV